MSWPRRAFIAIYLILAIGAIVEGVVTNNYLMAVAGGILSLLFAIITYRERSASKPKSHHLITK